MGWAVIASEVVVAVAPSSGAAAAVRLPDPWRSYAVLIGGSRYVVPVTGVTGVLLGQAATKGADVLVSAPPSPVYFSRPKETYTAFTGALITIMRNGIPGGPEFLTLGTIYGQLLYALASRGLPRPQQAGTGTADLLALARNPAYQRRQDVRLDVGHQPPQAARGRRRLTALAAAAVLGVSMILAALTQHQAGNTAKADPQMAPAISFSQASLSEPISFTVDISPAAVLDPATRSQAIRHIISGIDQQLATRHRQGQKVGLVQVFASGAIAGIARSEGAARLVLKSIQQRSLIFAAAAGQSFWAGTGGYFTFQIYFLR